MFTVQHDHLHFLRFMKSLRLIKIVPHISKQPLSTSLHPLFSAGVNMPTSHPEACTIPKDGGAMSNGDSYAAKESATDCLQAWSFKKWGMKLELSI